MPPKIPSHIRKVLQQLQVIDDHVSSLDRWSINNPSYSEAVEKLLRQLSELEALQPAFKLVDADLPWAVRAERLLAWMRTHPDFTSAGVKLCDDLPAASGSRGVILTEPVAKGATAFRIPYDCMLTTASALASKDLGPLIREEQLRLSDLPTVVLQLHLMAEHAKALEVPLKPEDAGKVPEPVHACHVAGAAEHKHDESCTDASHGHSHSHGGEACSADHGHSHGGGHGHSHDGGHGHSHGGSSHGHSHDGGHGHSHGGSSHGHSHDGGHGHSHGGGGHGHSHGGKPCTGDHGKGIDRQKLDTESHPWGSQFRAYMALMPANPRGCLYFSIEDFRRLKGTRAYFEAAQHLRNAAKVYISTYKAFGLGFGQLLDGFETHYTWAHFRWAMSCAMSRQNRVPSPEPIGPGEEPRFDLALVPLYDMVNHAEGPIESYFFGDTNLLCLDAMRDFSAGDELVMSYGGRGNGDLLIFQGFTMEGNPQDKSYVEAAMNGLATDPLFRIRANVLQALEIKPEHNAQRYLRAPELMQLEATAQKSGSKDALITVERYKWGAPFTFEVRPDGTLSHDLLSFLRVACINNKADAAEALKQCDQSRKAIIAAQAEYQTRIQDLHRRRLARRAAREDSAAAATAEEDAVAAAEEAEIERLEAGELPPLKLGVLSPANEKATWQAAIGAIAYAIKLIEEGGLRAEAYADASAAAAASLAPGPALDATAAAAIAAKAGATATESKDPVSQYRSQQVAILRRALELATKTAAELPE